MTSMRVAFGLAMLVHLSMCSDEVLPKMSAVTLTHFHVDKSGKPSTHPWTLPYGASKALIEKRCAETAANLMHRKMSDVDVDGYDRALDAAQGEHEVAVKIHCEEMMAKVLKTYAGQDAPSLPAPKAKPGKRIAQLLKKCSRGKDAAACKSLEDPVAAGCCFLGVAEKSPPAAARKENMEAARVLGAEVAASKTANSAPRTSGDPAYASLYLGVATERLDKPGALDHFKTAMYHFARTHTYNPEIKDCLQYASDRWKAVAGTSQEHLVRTRTIPGVVLATVDPKVDSDVSFVLHESGFWDMRTLELIRRALVNRPSGSIGSAPAGCFVDVGAHVGFFSMYGAALGHTVHAFEPADHHIKAIKRSLELNGPQLAQRFNLHEKVASDTKGEMAFSTFDIGPDGSSYASTKKSKGSKMIPSVRVSDTVTQPVDMMKIDVEGCELSVLKSSLKLISQGKTHNFLIEVCPYLWPRCGNSMSDAERVFGELIAQGFFLYVYDGDAAGDEFFKKNEVLPQVQMPDDDYQLFALPTELPEFMRVIKLQEEAKFCNHIWATPFDLLEGKRKHTEL